jgi:hypothetical protein
VELPTADASLQRVHGGVSEKLTEGGLFFYLFIYFLLNGHLKMVIFRCPQFH